MRLPTFVAVLLAVALGAPAAWAQAPEGGPFTTWVASDETEYRQGIAILSSAPAPATLTLDADITLDEGTDPVYTGFNPLTIDGDGHTIEAGGTSRILDGNPTSSLLLTLQDVTISGGAADGSGGAIFWDGPVTVTGGGLVDNHVAGAGLQSAGAVHANGDITLTDALVAQNSATSTGANANGGALYASQTGSDLVATRVRFENNSTSAPGNAANGGAAFSIADMTVTDSVVEDNTTSGLGAGSGALRPGGTATITGTTFEDNEANGGSSSRGGAIGAGSLSAVTITNSAFEDNEANATSGDASGGAVSGDVVTLEDSTVTDTTTSGPTGGYGAVWATTSVDLQSATIAGNGATTRANVATALLTGVGGAIGDRDGGTNCGGAGVTNNFSSTITRTVTDDTSCELVAGSGNQPDVDDLRLGRARNNGGTTPTRFPLAGSPVIDAVDAGSCTDAEDQRGIARPFDSACDAGAVEAVFEPHPFTDVDPWVEDAVRWLASDVNDPQLMVGLTPTRFRHDVRILRSQVVRLLYRLEGQPDPLEYDPHPFTDVPPWVEDAVRWAYGAGIVTGETPTLFKPNEPITRGQVVRMVYRIAGSPPVAGIDPHPFTDVPGWVEEAVRWAANTDNPLPLVTGERPTQFNAEEDIIRGQVARMVWRLALTPAAWIEPDDAPGVVLFGRGTSF